MPIGNKLPDRYEVKQTLGQGGMGTVYWAYDRLVRRDVALKTIRDAPGKAALELFFKECNILASISHPNVIEIYDIGKFEDEGGEKPYFVMPLLKGVTLDSLIRSSQLTVERTIEILCEACGGLHAAHQQGLLHGGLKPSNIFILEDRSVKLMDFGVARLADAGTASFPKSSVPYISPEQIHSKPAAATSDIFTLGVVAYEMLTLRRPFDGATRRDIATAILQHIPPPASDLNPAVNSLLGRVVHKAMAKQPWNRFGTARELAEALQKAQRNEPIESLDAGKIQPRIDRAAQAIGSGRPQSASEILTELESEGYLVPEMVVLRSKIERATEKKTPESDLPRAEDKDEMLTTDPENNEVAGPRQDMEADPGSGQVDEWLRLAREHLDRFDFSEARQAVARMLQVRASDTQALELVSEIERREQEYLTRRQEKEKLYQSAVEDYHKAELKTALSKLQRVLDLDRLAPEVSSTDGAPYQNLYNQVRSALDANTAAYGEARRCLDEDDFNRASEITEGELKKYPGQALFQALRFDIEDRKRQKILGYSAEVERNVDAEPDLDKRVDILRTAAGRFPDEQHFERALRLMSEKRDLVNSIVAKARQCEDQARYSEALDQWALLRTIYAAYPGLDGEIERVVAKRRSRQKRSEAVVHWAERIDHQIELPERPVTESIAAEKPPEVPGDPELVEMARLIRRGGKRNAGTRDLADQARALSDQGKFDEAASLVRRAYAADEKDLAVRGLLVATLVQHARSLLESDSKRADELVKSALELDPVNSEARGISTLLADRKRDEAIDQCINRTQQLQAAGDIAGAMAALEQVLAVYPTATRLQRLKVTLQRTSGDTDRTQTRRLDLEKLSQFEARAKTATDPDEQRAILAGVRKLAAKYLDDPAFQATLIAMEKRYVALGRVALSPPAAEAVASGAATPIPPMQVPAGPPPVPPAATRIPDVETEAVNPAPVTPAEIEPDLAPELLKQVAREELWTPVVTPPETTPPEIRLASAKEADSVPLEDWTLHDWPSERAGTPPPLETREGLTSLPPEERPPARDWKLWGAGAAGFALVAAAVIGTLVWRQHAPLKPDRSGGGAGITVPVDVQTRPEGATIRVNGKESGTSNLQLKLAPGTYRINAEREGYRPTEIALTVVAGHGGPLANLDLQPMPTALRLLTDFPSASISLDGHAQSNLQSGPLSMDNIAPGSHTLTIGSGKSLATIQFDAREGAPPVVTNLQASKDTSAILITNLGSRARIYSSQKAGPVTFDGKAAGSLDPLGVELSNVSPGDHEISIGEGANRRPVVYETALVPALTIYLNADQNQTGGNLLITTGEDDVRVSVDGKPLRAAVRRGQLRIPNLPAKEYVVSVAKDGFEPAPEQRVVVKKGEETKIAFQLRPIPAISMLHLAGAIPGTRVLLDGNAAGTVGPDGSIPAVQVTPGSHSVQLHRDEYKPKSFQLNFPPGKDVTLTGADVALEGTFGTLVVAVTPAAAQLTIRRSGDAQPRPLTGNSSHLPEGSYTITATSPHFVTQSANVEIATGSTKNVSLQLAPERVTQAPKPVTHVGMSGWQNPRAWQPEGDHFSRKGGNLCLFSEQGAGSYMFSVSMKRGKQFRWVAHVLNDKNYAEFELDSEYFYRRQVVDGKARELSKKKHGLNMDEAIAATLQVKISPAGILQSVKTAEGWSVLDSWMDPALQGGRFGFLIRGRDEVNLSAFWFTGGE